MQQMIDPQDRPDEELVVLCQQGRSECFEPLVRRYMQKAYHTAFGFTRDAESAKDLSQDAFLRAFSRIKQFDGRSSFYTWFYRILINLCLDHARRNRKVTWKSLDDLGDATHGQRQLVDSQFRPEQAAIAGEATKRASETLQAMPNKQRTAFLLRNDQGLSIADVAKVMKTTEGTVRVYLHRAVAALRQSLVEFV
ncbi:MAG TPA: sigma-70 family RNA polymerase sigma factor [Candidatus Limnocylindrales bacterium]|nr:sigma-70 family RNA polymerase sigma factor [Candidatus Limnocylindrales bacterium]